MFEENQKTVPNNNRASLYFFNSLHKKWLEDNSQKTTVSFVIDFGGSPKKIVTEINGKLINTSY